MHVLFVHQNFPAQFGQIASRLALEHGVRATFVSRKPPGHAAGIERLQYHLQGGATQKNHYCSRTFENATWHSHAIYEALRARPDVRPDLVVAHSGFCTSVFLRELYDCPIINYFEYFYRTANSDLDFRPEFPVAPLDLLRARHRNAALLLDLENCDAGYSPTQWQFERMPQAFRSKLRVIFDGIDTEIWKPRDAPLKQLGKYVIPERMKIITYVSRGMESVRGFDIFMKTARLLCQRRKDVLFVVVGQDRICYGGDKKVTGGKTFKEWVLAQDDYDLSRFIFTGLIPTPALARLLAATDLHIYLTVPFVLSWSLVNALACGATILASDTEPVREVIEHGASGLLVDFFDVEAWADTASRVLDAPHDYKHLGNAGAELVRQRYSLEVCLPQLQQFYEDVAQRRVAPQSDSRS